MADTNFNPTDIGTRYMTIKLILDTKLFPAGSNTKIITCNSDQNSLTAEATITKATGFSDATAYVTIYGLLNEDINAFSRFNLSFASQIPENWLEIYAGYSLTENGLPPLAYRGQVRLAAPNYNDPSRAFTIISQWGLVNQNTVSPTTAPQGSIDLNTLYSNIAGLFNPPLAYNGNNVTGVAINPNYSGSASEQINAATRDYGFKAKQDNGRLLVAPVGQPFLKDIYKLDSKNGMLGYPIGEEFGYSVRVRYNPQIQFGQVINVTSQVLGANSDWYINGMMTILQNRGQKWETTFKLNKYLFLIEA